jgi:hypothetical protein
VVFVSAFAATATTGRNATGGASFLPQAASVTTASKPNDQARAVRTEKDLSALSAARISLPNPNDGRENGRDNNSDGNMRRQTCKITNDLGAKAFRASKMNLRTRTARNVDKACRCAFSICGAARGALMERMKR